MANLVRPESLGGDHGPARTLADARIQYDRRPPEAVAEGYWAVFREHRARLIKSKRQNDTTRVELPGQYRTREIRNLTYRHILDIAHRRAEAAVNRANADYRIHGELRGKMQAGEAL